MGGLARRNVPPGFLGLVGPSARPRSLGWIAMPDGNSAPRLSCRQAANVGDCYFKRTWVSAISNVGVCYFTNERGCLLFQTWVSVISLLLFHCFDHDAALHPGNPNPSRTPGWRKESLAMRT